jgi:alanine transaminase
VLDDVGEHIRAAQYAVRGAIPIRGGEIATMLKKGQGNFDFKETTYLNIGNP